MVLGGAEDVGHSLNAVHYGAGKVVGRVGPGGEREGRLMEGGDGGRGWREGMEGGDSLSASQCHCTCETCVLVSGPCAGVWLQLAAVEGGVSHGPVI